MTIANWFLGVGERDNSHSAIDRRRDGVPWTEGNRVEILIDGTEYFSHLYAILGSTVAGDSVYLTGLEDDSDERLAGPGTEVSRVLGDLAKRGVGIRGLVWRSHSGKYAEGKNLMFSRALNIAGGEVLLDNRIRRGGSHHQKLVVIRRASRPADDVAYVGGMDLVHGRHDDQRHLGDPQPAELDTKHYGVQPGWHDVQIALTGPVVDDVAVTFGERWDDPAPLDTRSPFRWILHRFSRQPATRSKLAAERVDAPRVGPHAVQVLRTYPACSRPYPFAPEGERSIARGYIKSFARARSFIYLEDQYLWSYDASDALCAALRREPDLLVVIVIPRYPDPAGRIAGPASVLGRERVQDAMYAAGGDRVAIFDLEREDGTAVYVHSKACIVDDIWLAVGSDNLNRRSWTHDSELSCAIVDETRDEREPRDPAGLGDGARKLARDTRLRLAHEHTGGVIDVNEMINPQQWFSALRRSAENLDEWRQNEQRGPRPPGHLRYHTIERINPVQRRLLRWVHSHVLDPDGRPSHLKRTNSF